MSNTSKFRMFWDLDENGSLKTVQELKNGKALQMHLH